VAFSLLGSSSELQCAITSVEISKGIASVGQQEHKEVGAHENEPSTIEEEFK
jgi:hypothetical protein